MEGKLFDVLVHALAGAVGGIVRYYHLMSLHDRMRVSLRRMSIHVVLGTFVGVFLSDLIAPGTWGRLAMVMAGAFCAPMLLYALQLYVPKVFARRLREVLDDDDDVDGNK